MKMESIYNIKILLKVVMVLTLVTLTEQLERNYDIEYICGQTLPVFDSDLTLNGRPSFAPSDVPQDCVVFLESGYSDGAYRLQIIIEAIDIKNCGVNVAIFNGHGAFGNYLRQVTCRSMTTDTLYTENKDATIRLHRPLNVADDAYVFTIKSRAYKDDGTSAILQTGANLPPGAIAGIIISLLVLVIVAILLIWCWTSGRITRYIHNDDEFYGGEENFGVEKSDNGSVKSGVDQKDPLVWNTTASGKYDPKTVPLGRRSFRDAKSRGQPNGPNPNGVAISTAANGDSSAAWQKEQTELKQPLQNEIKLGRGLKGEYGTKFGDQKRKDTLIDDVFESDDNKTLASRHKRHGADDEGNHYTNKGDIEGGNFRRNDPTRGSGDNRGSGRGDNNRGSLRRGEDGSPTRGSLRRGEVARGSNKSTGSNKEDQMIARTLADEAAAKKLKSSKPSASARHGPQVDPPSDFDSSSFMSVPEAATVTAAVHQVSAAPSSPPPPPPPPIPGEDNTSEDSELREINSRAAPDDSSMMPNPNIQQSKHKDSQKSPSSKKKKKKKQKHQEVEEDRLPPEAFEPLFDRPVSEDPYPAGMQPLNMGYNNMYGPGGMYPMQPHGMPYGMMPGQPGTQTYSYAYQTAPQPGVAPQQVAGKAAWVVQETPTKNGPIQKTSFMMATTESRPESQQNSHGSPNRPGYSSNPYQDTPRRKGSGRKRTNNPDNYNNTSLLPAGNLSPDNGQGHRSAMMKSGVDPNTGIETRQALWTDTTRDPTDPTPEGNPKINRKTVTRTTTRGGYGDLPQHVDNITDHLYISMEPEDPAFLSPSGTGAHAISSTATPERDNASYYAGLHHNPHSSPHRAIQPPPNRHNF